MGKSNSINLSILLAAALLAISPFKSFAAGYQMRYQSAETMGTAFASDVSGSKTASGFYNNPSQLLFLEDGIHASVEAMGLFPMGDFEDGTNPFGGTNSTEKNFSTTSIIPSIYYGQKLADKYGVVVTFTIPWATNTEYSDDWIGRFAGIKTYLATYNLTPSFVYSINDKLSVSAGPQIQMIKGELSSALPPAAPQPSILSIEGDDIAIGAVLSALYKASESLKVGFTYKSRVNHGLSGDMTLDSAAPALPGIGATGNDVNLDISTPEVITIGATYTLSEKIDLHGTLSWTGWSVLKELAIENETTGDDLPPTVTKWNNTTFVAFGSDYKHSEKWTFRGGLSYETGAPSDEFRSPRGVDEDRIVVGLGTGYKLSEKMSINGALTQLFFTKDPEIDLPAVTGKYSGNMATAIRVGLSANF